MIKNIENINIFDYVHALFLVFGKNLIVIRQQRRQVDKKIISSERNVALRF